MHGQADQAAGAGQVLDVHPGAAVHIRRVLPGQQRYRQSRAVGGHSVHLTLPTTVTPPAETTNPRALSCSLSTPIWTPSGTTAIGVCWLPDSYVLLACVPGTAYCLRAMEGYPRPAGPQPEHVLEVPRYWQSGDRVGQKKHTQLGGPDDSGGGIQSGRLGSVGPGLCGVDGCPELDSVQLNNNLAIMLQRSIITMMIQRAAKTRLLDSLQRFPAVALLGPRQAGKTTLALSLEEHLKPQALYLDLELPSDGPNSLILNYTFCNIPTGSSYLMKFIAFPAFFRHSAV